MQESPFLAVHACTQLAEKQGKADDGDHKGRRHQNRPQHVDDIVFGRAIVEHAVADVIAELGRAGQEGNSQVNEYGGEPDHEDAEGDAPEGVVLVRRVVALPSAQSRNVAVPIGQLVLLVDVDGQEVVSGQGHEEDVGGTDSIAVGDVHVQQESAGERDAEDGFDGVENAVVGQEGVGGGSEPRAHGCGAKDEEVAQPAHHSHRQEHGALYLGRGVTVDCGVA